MPIISSRGSRTAWRRAQRGVATVVLTGAVGVGASVGACGEPSGESVFPNGGSPDATTGDGGGPGPGPVFVPGPTEGGAAEPATALAFDPPSVTITVDGTTPLSRELTVRATLTDGRVRVVQAEALQLDRPDIATVTAGSPLSVTATGTYAGVATLHAVYGGASATATIAVTIRKRDLNGVDAAIAAKLDAAGLAADAVVTSDKVLYPYDKTVFPLGLTSPLFMWQAPRATDVYRVRLEEKSFVYDFYGSATMPGRLRLPQEVWDRVTASNGGAADPLKVTITRWDQPTDTAFTSATREFGIALASVRGAIYYWNASQTIVDGGVSRIGAITRIRPGTGATPVKLNEGRCMGCHSVSADGTTLVATVEHSSAPSVAPYTNWSGVRAWAGFQLPAGTLIVQTTKSGANSALTPDGKYVVFGGAADSPTPGSKYISLATTATGDVIANSGLDAVALPAGHGIMMPAFSPDGKKLAFVEAGGDLDDNVIPSPSHSLRYLAFDQAQARFDPTLHTIASASAFATGNAGLGYPSFTPDSAWVAYHTGPNSTGCFDGPGSEASPATADSCNDLTPDRGEIWMSSADGLARIRLDRLNDPPALADRYVNREPTFNPVERGGYAWVVFTSMRDWGNELTGAAINGKRRLWVAAIDRTIGTLDPSHPPFYLEGQEGTPNMRGFWALAQCTQTPAPGAGGGTCAAGFECCSGFCDKGVCVEPSQIACKAVGDTCVTTSDCCNARAVECTNGRCTATIPR